MLSDSACLPCPAPAWEDYDTSLISKGGGLFSRNAKSIKLSPEARQALGIENASMTPNELINAILKAPVDLLWNGGIGTYVKASSESHVDAADRANDAVRVNGDELRCKVVGEGGNLGLTQLGRIEFAELGGRYNYTDAIDNSAGVDCSDHEVNIKILLDQVVEMGELTEKQRNQILEDMTDEVGELVLMDNYQQTQCISTEAMQASALMDEHARFMQHLEAEDKLNRAIEFLPDNEQIAERLANGRGLSRPEISVVVSYAKMTMFEDLLDSDLPGRPFLTQGAGRLLPQTVERALPRTDRRPPPAP